VPDFDQWYRQKEETMKADPVMKYFSNLRTEIEHKARTPTSQSAHINRFTPDDLKRFPKPPNATGFFIGDSSGGSGWTVTKSDGSTERYYVDLPSDIGQSQMMLPPDAPSRMPGEVPGKGDLSAQDLVAVYLGKVEEIVREARQRFLGPR
jgi:hypothetical protein